MLDSDLALLYRVETKVFIQSVKRNIKRFPQEFMFQITNDEFNNLRSQIVTSKGRGGRRYNPYAFTEQGVAMLSSILHSDIAIQTSISIINAFVKMRHLIGNNDNLLFNMETKLIEHDNKIKLLEDSFNKLESKRKNNDIYFNGQIFDAYFKINEIFNEATNEIIIIDSYADINILNIIKKLNVKVIVITKPNNLLTKQDIEKYNEQYNNLKVVYDNTFHDRYFVIDRSLFYHCGTSINRIGHKTFSINIIGDDYLNNALIDKINKYIN